MNLPCLPERDPNWRATCLSYLAWVFPFIGSAGKEVIMARLLSIVPMVMLAALAACETLPYETANYRPGFGVVETVAIVDVGAAGVGAPVGGGVVGTILDSQAARGTGPVATVSGATAGAYVERRAFVEAYQLTVRMDDGTVQTVVQDNRLFHVGDRVQITPDGRVIQL